MKRAALHCLVWILCALLLLTACEVKEEENPIQVTLVASDCYKTEDPHQVIITPGDEVRFVLEPVEGYVISGSDYPGSIAADGPSGKTILILPNVKYPARVTVLCEKDDNICTIHYDANGGTALDGTGTYTVHHALNGHLRPNTDTGIRIQKENSTLLCWNTHADGSGLEIGLGSRCGADCATLYAQWAQWSDCNLFQFEKENDGYTVVRYLGEEPQVVIPNTYNGLPVKKIVQEAFSDKVIRKLVLPVALEKVENGAFSRCSIEKLLFFDNLLEISDGAFSETLLPAVFLNAVQPPRYAGSGRMSTYADKLDMLMAHEFQRKIILFGGSGTYYSVLAAEMQQLLNGEYYVLNMGMNGWFPAEPQMELIREYMHEGDILLHIPEETSLTQLFASTAFAMNVDAPDVFDDRYMRSLELNYALITAMDLNLSPGFFDSFSRFNQTRQDQEYTEYSAYSHYINENGDYPGKKLSYQKDESITGEADIRPELLTDPACARLDAMYASFADKGVQVVIAYAAVNESALKEIPNYMEKATLFDSLLRGKIQNASVIEKIADSFYPGSVFYNSDWHLSEEADRKNTAMITECLLEFLAEHSAPNGAIS